VITDQSRCVTRNISWGTVARVCGKNPQPPDANGGGWSGVVEAVPELGDF